jgi:hypothetical protein
MNLQFYMKTMEGPTVLDLLRKYNKNLTFATPVENEPFDETLLNGGLKRRVSKIITISDRHNNLPPLCKEIWILDNGHAILFGWFSYYYGIGCYYNVDHSPSFGPEVPCYSSQKQKNIILGNFDTT